MKIKEVIDKTGLTDRAIRLYIENGLITPENQKSYTGRNSFHFTPSDVEKLEQIALLRRADFSLEQIKILEGGGESAHRMLKEYVEAKRESVILGQHIVEALQALPIDQPVTMESVCVTIEESLKDQPVPEIDKKPSVGERVETWVMRVAAIIILLPFGLFTVIVLNSYRTEFPFPHFYAEPAAYIGTVYLLLPIVAAIAVLILYRKTEFIKKKRTIRSCVAGIILPLAYMSAVNPLGLAALALLPPVYSETEAPEDYLVLGTYMQLYKDSIFKLFPTSIPQSAIAEDSAWYPPDKFKDTTKYYYYYQNAVDPSFQLYAEWVLPSMEFDREVQRIRNYYPEGPKQQVQWGDWTCLNFTDDPLDHAETEELNSYYYLMFAYNEKTHSVRYIASYTMDRIEEDEPYFLLLSWE